VPASHRGQYNIRHTFITMALSAGDDPGWVAEVCGTSEEMIWRHYRKWIPGEKRDHGQRIASALGRVRAREMPAGGPRRRKASEIRGRRVEAGGIENRPPSSDQHFSALFRGQEGPKVLWNAR
jgi:hypothetical protein